MLIHHLNCGTLHPYPQRLVNGHGSLLRPGRLCCRVLLVSGDDGWTMIDTGLGTADLRDPYRRLGTSFVRTSRPVLDADETAVAQVRRLGIDPEQVTRIVLTHLDIDHAGGIGDFPHAEIHLSTRQLDLVTATDASGARRPHLDASVASRLHDEQWAHGPRWVPHDLGESYAGRPASRVTEGVQIVALDGHLAGHCGVVVRRPGEPDLIHAGDAFFATNELRGARTPWGLSLFERRMRTDPPAWRASRDWLADRHREGAQIICAHEPW